MRGSRLVRTIAVQVTVVASCLFGFRTAEGEDLGHPTLEEFKEEICRANAIAQGHVTGIAKEDTYQGKPKLRMLKIHVDKVYKGNIRTPEIVVGNYCAQYNTSIMGAGSERKPGDEVILCVKRLAPLSSNPKPFGQKCCYVTPFIYHVVARSVESPTGMGADLTPYRRIEDFTELIEQTVARDLSAQHKAKGQEKEYVLRKVLFQDSFADNSMSGWTLLKGSNPAGYVWLAEGSTWKNTLPGKEGSEGHLERTRAGRLMGEYDDARFDIGVYNSWLRLRSVRGGYHITTVAGNPNWSDYQIDADVALRLDAEKPTLVDSAWCHGFGILGRVTVPHLPNTKGDHCEIGVEFGSWNNQPATLGTVDRETIQIRLKAPDANDGGYYGVLRTRTTKILDAKTFEVVPKKALHITAKFMGRRVEGWVDGKKYLEGLIPESNWEQFRQGRIALWEAEDFVEFSNVKVTQLVQKKSEER